MRKVQVERSDSGKRNRIYLRTPYSPDIPRLCKKVSGASWSSSKKLWSYPLEYSTCVELRQVFGTALEIGPELWKWAQSERVRADEIATALEQGEVDCPRVRTQEPRLWTAFENRPYQKLQAAVAAKSRYWLNGDDPGLGKTLETFGAVVEAGIETGVVFVLCPTVAIDSTWAREIARWLPNDNILPCVGDRKTRLATLASLADVLTDRRTWLIGNIEMLRVKFSAHCPGPTDKEFKTLIGKGDGDPCDGEYVGCLYAKRHKQVAEPSYPGLFGPDWQAIVLDESHKAIVTTKSRKQKQSQTRVGFGMLKLADDGLRLALSGTPWRGKPQNFWGTLNWLRPEIYTGYWRWAEKFFDIDTNGFGRTIGDIKPEMEEEWGKELDSVMLRRTKAEVAKDLPPKQYAGTPHDPSDENSPIGVWLDMEPGQAKVYHAMRMNAAAQLEGGTLMGNGVLSEMTRLMQLSVSGMKQDGWRKIKVGMFEGKPVFQEVPEFVPTLPSNKFNWLVEKFLPERGILGDIWGDKKVVISSKYTSVLNMFRAELTKKGVSSHILTGETKARDRTRQIAEFQGEGGPRVFFLNTKAGGVSITLDAADDLVVLDRTWIPDDDTQVEDRIHRVSRTDHQATIFYLYSVGTIEEHIATTAEGRDNIQRKFLDGRRGVEYAKRLVSV